MVSIYRLNSDVWWLQYKNNCILEFADCNESLLTIENSWLHMITNILIHIQRTQKSRQKKYVENYSGLRKRFATIK